MLSHRRILMETIWVFTTIFILTNGSEIHVTAGDFESFKTCNRAQKEYVLELQKTPTNPNIKEWSVDQCKEVSVSE